MKYFTYKGKVYEFTKLHSFLYFLLHLENLNEKIQKPTEFGKSLLQKYKSSTIDNGPILPLKNDTIYYGDSTIYDIYSNNQHMILYKPSLFKSVEDFDEGWKNIIDRKIYYLKNSHDTQMIRDSCYITEKGPNAFDMIFNKYYIQKYSNISTISEEQLMKVKLISNFKIY